MIASIRLGVAAALALLPVAAAGQGASPKPTSTTEATAVRITFEKYSLPNGLVVILSEDHRLPLVATNIWYHVGPANELPGRTGFAHLFEHMMFEGSRHVPGSSHARYLEAAGVSLWNGTTDFDRTNYFETLPSNRLELALWLESDRMGYLPDKLDQASLTNQQAVVRNERRQGVENQPYGIVEEALYHNLFPSDHPYYAEVIGSHADIQAAKLQDVRDFFRLYYAPNNATIAIVGDFDPKTVKALVAKYFGPLKRGAPVPKIKVVTPPITAERRAVVQDQVELPRVYEAWLTPPIFSPGNAEGDLAARILGGGKSSRLYRKLVYEQQIALDVSVSQNSLLLGSVFEITVTARPGHTAEEIEQAIDAEVDAFRKDGPTEAELQRAKNGTETGIVRALQSLGGFGGVADRLLLYDHYLHDPGYVGKDLRRYQGATLATVHAFAQSQLKPTARVVVFGVPGKQALAAEVPTPPSEEKGKSAGGEAVNADVAWRAEPPKPGPARPLDLPVPQSFTLDNGLTVLYEYRPGLPLVAAGLVINSGSGANPVDKPGLASLTAEMLQQGTASRSATQIADEMAFLGASLGSNANMDRSFMFTSALRRNASQALDVMADLALRSSFPAEEVERRRAARLAALSDERGDPESVALRVSMAALFGLQSSLGYTNSGTESAIKGLTRDDLLQFWKGNFVPGNAALIVSGDIALADVKSLAQEKFGAWGGGSGTRAAIPAPTSTKARVVIVDRPGAQQTVVRLLQLGVGRSTPDYAPLEVMNAELGGLFSSRINMNLREAHGYTYGAFSDFVYRRSQGYFRAGGGIRTDATADAVREFFKEIQRMVDTPMTADEIKVAQESEGRSLPGLFETNEGAAQTLAEVFVYGLPNDYYSTLPGRFSAVTIADAQAVAAKYLHPEQMLVVCVGDRAKIEPELKKLDLGTIEIRDADGNVLP